MRAVTVRCALVALLACWLSPAIAGEESPGREAPPRKTISLARSPFIFGSGGVGTSMDAMPFFHDGRWHLFHMQTGPRGIAHRVSADLVHWDVRPLAIPGPVATGSVVEHQGTFYFLYTSGRTVHLATSRDLDYWTLHDRNPVAVVDGHRYAGPDFRDPYVFYHQEEACWWMLITTRVPGRHRMRAGCVGVYKSRDLLTWEAAEPLWAPGLNAHHECPQVIQHQDRWYLFNIERQDQYRVAESLAGPWMRPPNPSLGTHTVLAGSRLASDGERWVSFPFLCARRGPDEFGEIVQAEVYAIPRQLSFGANGSITQQPVNELVEAMHALAPLPALARTTAVSGSWEIQEHTAAIAHTGTLVLDDVPPDCYFEADVTLATRNMEAGILLRANADLTEGYRLELHPGEGIVSFRPFSYWDRDRVLVSQRVDLPVATPFKIRVFVSGTVMEAFVDDRVVLSSRLYRHPDGHVALLAADGKATFGNIIVRRLSRENGGPPQ